MATNLPSCFSIQFLKQLLKFLVNLPMLKYVKSQRNYGFLITKGLIFDFQILDLKDHFSASITGPCFKIRSSPSFSSFVHELCLFDCATLLGNSKMFAVYQIHLCSFFLFLALLIHLEQNISLSAVRSLADKRFLLVVLCRFFLYSC